jgi:cytochrome c oxidase subunit IV
MADKKAGKGAGAKGAAEAKKSEDAAEKPAAAHGEAHDDKPAVAHGGAHAHGAHGEGHGHGHKPNIREYMIIFAVLFVLTVLEVAVAQVPGISKGLMAIALIGLALTKAACVGLYYMHLKHETKILKLTVALPFAAPAVYALVLISEAAWRLTR